MSLFDDNAIVNQPYDNKNDDDPYGMEEYENPFDMEVSNSEEIIIETENDDDNDQDQNCEIDFDAVFDENKDELEFHDASEANKNHEHHVNTEDLFYIPESKDSVCLKLPDETSVTYNHTLKELEFKTDIGTFLNSSFVPPDPRKTTSLPSPRDAKYATRNSTINEELIFGDSTFRNHGRKKASTIIMEDMIDGAGTVNSNENLSKSENDNKTIQDPEMNDSTEDSTEYIPKKSLLERLMDHEKHGSMVKLGAIKHKIYGDSWKKRYFELKQGRITYRENKGTPVIKTINLHSLCTISKRQATDNARKDRYDMKEFHNNEKTGETLGSTSSLQLSDYDNLDHVLNKNDVTYLGKVGRDHTLELHVPLSESDINNPQAFHRTYYMQCESSTEEASWYEEIQATIQVYRDFEKEELLEKQKIKQKEEDEERRKQVESELEQMQQDVTNLSIEEKEKARKAREEELAKNARRALKAPVDVNALIRTSNHPDMSVLYYQKLLYTDMTEDELIPYIYLFYDKVKEVCGVEEF